MAAELYVIFHCARRAAATKARFSVARIWHYGRTLSYKPGGDAMFDATHISGSFLPTNDGSSWTPVDLSFGYTGAYCLIADGKNIFAGTGGVFLSTDNVVRWRAVDSGLGTWT